MNNYSTPIYVDNRIVGEVRDGTFCKQVLGSKHFLRKPPAIAFDIASLEGAEQAGAKRVEIEDIETGRVYRTTIARIWRDGVEFDRGWGRQIYLTLRHWQGQTQGSPFAEQLPLWAEVGA